MEARSQLRHRPTQGGKKRLTPYLKIFAQAAGLVKWRPAAPALLCARSPRREADRPHHSMPGGHVPQRCQASVDGVAGSVLVVGVGVPLLVIGVTDSRSEVGVDGP